MQLGRAGARYTDDHDGVADVLVEDLGMAGHVRLDAQPVHQPSVGIEGEAGEAGWREVGFAQGGGEEPGHGLSEVAAAEVEEAGRLRRLLHELLDVEGGAVVAHH